ncbi:hypothetical protein NKJ23_15905 [Mesorhizobium sp. M0184]|uniref:hypothetical protein n=1 Tax=Mesorhizobium sp. M0184 TaxID=2956906 RepID=UPI00333A4CB6
MSNNAMWHAHFRVTRPNGNTFSELVSLMSPDLVDTREAKRRATATARARLQKKLAKTFMNGEKLAIFHIETRCVG